MDIQAINLMKTNYYLKIFNTMKSLFFVTFTKGNQIVVLSSNQACDNLTQKNFRLEKLNDEKKDKAVFIYIE